MNPEEAKRLREPFPPVSIGKLPARRGSSVELDYVGHAAVTHRLLEVDPDWTWEPLAYETDGMPRIVWTGERAVMWIKLRVLGITRLGVGTVTKGVVDPEKQLIGDALRNAAMRFGVALDLWSKEELGSQTTDEPVDGSGHRVGSRQASEGFESPPAPIDHDIAPPEELARTEPLPAKTIPRPRLLDHIKVATQGWDKSEARAFAVEILGKDNWETLADVGTPDLAKLWDALKDLMEQEKPVQESLQ